jgi:hypothetical protein
VTEALAIGIHAMPCSNRCRHCWTEGSPRHEVVPAERVVFVLERLAALREMVPYLSFFLYDEPTIHPRFVEILEAAAGLGLTGEGFFLPTNGHGLVSAPDEVWDRLRRAGADRLQFTLYGLEEAHDAFAGRAGAFRDVVDAIRGAAARGFSWYAGVVLHAGHAAGAEETMDFVRGLDPSGAARVGCLSFLWQGRGRDAARLRAADRPSLPDGFNRSPVWVEEGEAVRRILADPELAARRPGEGGCETTMLQVDRDGRVFAGSSCDAGGIAAAVPELRESFALGPLGPEGFAPLLDAFADAPPPALARLGQVTWGELAERYGDAEGDGIHFLDDLPNHKWAAAYLLESLG